MTPNQTVSEPQAGKFYDGAAGVTSWYVEQVVREKVKETAAAWRRKESFVVNEMLRRGFGLPSLLPPPKQIGDSHEDG